jgi:hypothetical protein
MDNFQMSGADSRAICTEIGERLRGSLTAADHLSPRLRRLMEQMVTADGDCLVTVTAA